MSDSNFGINFNPNEKDDLLNFPSLDFEKYTGGGLFKEYLPEGGLDFGGSNIFSEEFNFETNYFNTTEITKEIIKDKEEKTEETDTKIPYRDPLRKIGGGRVLQYPIDLDTDIQDYFEIQVFKYRPAGGLPSIKYNNQGSNPAGVGGISGAYNSNSNRRGNRQNFRLQDLQSTIQLPMPPSIKDTNSVDFGGGNMSGFAAALFGPVVASFLNKQGGSGDLDQSMFNEEGFLQGIRSRAQNIIRGGVGTIGKMLGEGFNALGNKEFRRFTSLNAIAQAVAALGVNIDVNQAITRTSGAVRNPNLELLFKGPALRSFSFTIRLTPRSPEES